MADATVKGRMVNVGATVTGRMGKLFFFFFENNNGKGWVEV